MLLMKLTQSFFDTSDPIFNMWSDVHFLQTLSFTEEVEKSRNEGKFSASNLNLFLLFTCLLCLGPPGGHKRNSCVYLAIKLVFTLKLCFPMVVLFIVILGGQGGR